MIDINNPENQIQLVNSIQDLIATPFQGEVNAMCWSREIKGDFSEIVGKVEIHGNIVELGPKELYELELSEQGQLAREILLNDLKALKNHGASPILNVIKSYDRDDFFFPTDVYSLHVDRSPIATDTFLCTYYGEPSEIVPNYQADQKIIVPEIRKLLNQLYDGPDEGFESFLSEYFFDLHYQEKKGAQAISLGIGHLWKLAIDHPESHVLPCLHRAPIEKNGQKRLLLIC